MQIANFQLQILQFTICNLHFAISGSSRPVAVQVLDGRFVTPGDLVDGDAEDGGDFLALGGAGCPAAERDGGDAAIVESGPPGQLSDADALFSAEVGDGADHKAGSGEQDL
jgi:hypothetical protein